MSGPGSTSSRHTKTAHNPGGEPRNGSTEWVPEACPQSAPARRVATARPSPLWTCVPSALRISAWLPPSLLRMPTKPCRRLPRQLHPSPARLQPFIPQTLPPPGRRLSPNISPKRPPFSDHRKLKRSFQPSWPLQEDRHHLGARSPEQPIHINVPWPFLRSPRILCQHPNDAIIPQLLHQRSHGSPGIRQLPHSARAGASPVPRQAAAGTSGQPRQGP